MAQAILELKELCEMSRKAKSFSEDRCVFLGENRERVREIGQIIHERGGLPFMQLILSDFFFVMREELEDTIIRGDQKELSAAWHGIGDWWD